MLLKEISNLASETWNRSKNKHPDVLIQNLWASLRDTSCNSDLIATPITTVMNQIPNFIMDVVLGLVSEIEFEATIEVGGARYGDTIKLKPMEPTFILVDPTTKLAYPLQYPQYNAITIMKIPLRAKVWALGIRLKKEDRDAISKMPTQVPNLMRFEKECAVSTLLDPVVGIEEWSPLV